MSVADPIIGDVYRLMGAYQQDVLDYQKSSDSADRALRARQIEGSLANAAAAIKNDKRRIEIERGRAEAEKWASEQQVKLGVLGHMISRGELGLEWTKQAVEYAQTADNYFKLMDFMRGAKQRQDVPVYLQSLLQGVQMPAWTEQGGMPVPRDINDLVSSFGVDPNQFQVGGTGAPGTTAGTGLTFFGGEKGNQVGFYGQQGTTQQNGAIPVSAQTMDGAPVPAQLMAGQRMEDKAPQGSYYQGTYNPAGAVNYATPNDATKGGKNLDRRMVYTAPNQPDPRQQAITGIVKNMLPSTTEGADAQDQAALNAISALYAAPGGVQPGQFESLSPTERSLYGAGVGNLGGDYKAWLTQWQKSRPGQGAATGA